MLTIVKTHPKSFFRNFVHDSPLAKNLFSETPTYDKEPVVVLQIICINDTLMIAEIVFEKHYNASYLNTLKRPNLNA